MKINKKLIQEWQLSLCPKIELGGLYSRNPTAHKWKAPYRSIVLRELVFWRLSDLLLQAVALAENNHHLGARILLRSAFETLGILIYLNKKTEAVLTGVENFNAFSEITSKLMLGSKDSSTEHESVNIITVLKKSDKKYPGLYKLYTTLSESAHPNYEGVCSGYSYIDYEKDETIFENRWTELHASSLEAGITTCMRIFETEYDDVWSPNFEKLETWIQENDEQLEQQKNNI